MKPDSLHQRLERARPLLEPEWSAERAGAVRRKMERTRRKRQTRRAALALLALLTVGGAAALRWQPAAEVQLADVRISPLGGETRVSRGPVQPGLESVLLEQGGAWFEVERNPARTFRVSAGSVEVEVLGTRFLVRRQESRVHVVVEHGRVRVRWPQGSRELTGGQSAWFPPLEPPAPAAPAAPPAAPELAPEPVQPEPAAPVRPARRQRVPLEVPAPAPLELAEREPAESEPAESWQQLAQQGDFDRAWQVLSQQRTPLRDESAELLLAADVARLSRHPSEALAPLGQVVERHAADPRAPLAAFTLGRVLLEQLGRPHEAAQAFARARALNPSTPLAEDALARQVEACSRAGDTAQALKLAQDFMRLYPSSQRLRAVRHYGGLE